jgi:hypothetical protein
MRENACPLAFPNLRHKKLLFTPVLHMVS